MAGSEGDHPLTSVPSTLPPGRSTGPSDALLNWPWPLGLDNLGLLCGWCPLLVELQDPECRVSARDTRGCVLCRGDSPPADNLFWGLTINEGLGSEGLGSEGLGSGLTLNISRRWSTFEVGIRNREVEHGQAVTVGV